MSTKLANRSQFETKLSAARYACQSLLTGDAIVSDADLASIIDALDSLDDVAERHGFETS